jgi:hypothetical protein
VFVGVLAIVLLSLFLINIVASILAGEERRQTRREHA